MKKLLGRLMTYCLIFLASFIGFKIYLLIAKKQEIKKNIALLGDFSKFKAIDNNGFAASLSMADSVAIVSHFSPDCEHCQNMARLIFGHRNEFGHILIIMVAHDKVENIVKFQRAYNLDQLKNIVFMQDPEFLFGAVYGTENIPSYFIYRNRKLLKRITGETSIEKLIKL